MTTLSGNSSDSDELKSNGLSQKATVRTKARFIGEVTNSAIISPFSLFCSHFFQYSSNSDAHRTITPRDFLPREKINQLKIEVLSLDK
jgi:hypothetical protein